MDARSIPFVQEVVDLGVTVDKKLRFTSHVATICCKAHRRANLILKCFHAKDTSSLLSAYRAYVRPILEYNCVVWNLFLLKDINALEAVQRRFTKRIPHFKNLTYHQRLSQLGIESLEVRRIRADLLFAYKLVFGLVDINAEVFLPLVLRSITAEDAIVTNCSYLHVKPTQGITVLAIESCVCGTVFRTVLILIHIMHLRDR